MDVRLPDGTIIKNVPEGTTQSQLMARVSGQGSIAPIQQTQPVEELNFFQRVGEDALKRSRRIGEGFEAHGLSLLGKDQTLPETVMQATGQGLGFLGDVLGNVALSGYRSLPDVPYGIEELGQAVGSIPLGDKTVVERMAEGTQTATDFAKENPRAARNIDSLVNIAAFYSPVKGLGSAGQVGAKTGQAIKNVGSAIAKQIPEPKNITSQMLRSEASKFYQMADDLGGVVKPERLTTLADDIATKIIAQDATLPSATQKALRKVADPEGVVRQASDVFDSLRGNSLTLEGFKTVDQTLGDLAYKKSTPNDVSRKILMMQDELRSMVDSISPDDLVGSGQGFEAYAAARELWKKQAKIKDLENITSKAFATDQPTNTLKRSLKRFLANEKNTKGFSDVELDAIRKASEDGIADNLVRMVSGRLPSSVAMATNPVLAPALSTAAKKSRSMADDAMIKQMQNINNLIATGSPEAKDALGALTKGAGKAIEKTGAATEKAFSNGRGRLTTLGTIQQQLEELNRRNQ